MNHKLFTAVTASAFLGFAGLANAGLKCDVAPSGQAQTPIDFQVDDDYMTEVSSRTAPVINWTSSASLKVKNTGSPDEYASIKAEITGNATTTFNGKTYTLAQFHFHTPSEHTLNGSNTEMEVHFVHVAADGSLLVIGRFIDAGAANNELGKFFGKLPTDTSKYVSVSRFNLNNLLPNSRSRQTYRYAGSLTTPDFCEGVQWLVLNEHMTMSRAQIDAFKALFPHNNYRHTFPLNGRQITTDLDL